MRAIYKYPLLLYQGCITRVTWFLGQEVQASMHEPHNKLMRGTPRFGPSDRS